MTTQAEQDFRERVTRLDRDLIGTFGLYVRDLAGGWETGLHEDELFPTASVFKLFVLVTVFARNAAGNLDLDAMVTAPARRGDCGGTFGALSRQPELSLRDHLKLMIMYSDNRSTDLLLDMLGKGTVNETIRGLGLPRSHIGFNTAEMHYHLAGMADAEQTPENDRAVAELLLTRRLDPNHVTVTNDPRNNVTTPREIGDLLSRMFRGELVSRDASAAMLDMLRLTPSRENFPRYLPPTLPVAHKDGSFRRMQNDVGFIFFPDRPFLFCGFCRDLPFNRNDLGMEVLGQAAHALFEMVETERLAPPDLSEAFAGRAQAFGRTPIGGNGTTGRGPVTISLVGDIYLGSGVEARLQELGAAAFAAIVPLLGADLVVGNLETPLVTRAEVDPNRGGMKSRAELSDALFALGFDVFCLANNHTMDCGAPGMHETMSLLEKRGVGYYGAGDNLAAARQPLIVERCGLRIGFLGYSQPELDSATPDAAGVAPLRRSTVLADIAAVRPQVDALVVSLHEGFEFSDYPRLQFVQFCRETVEAGATVIYGHHPHVPHGVELHRGGLILYSVGNFIFDLPYHREHRWTRQCAIVRVTLDGNGVAGLEFRPVVLGPNHLPWPATPPEAQEILAHLRGLSAPLGDLDFIRRRNGEFVNEVMRVVLSAPYQFGQQNNATAQEFFWKRQIHRWPYNKAFCDFATLVAGYEPLA